MTGGVAAPAAVAPSLHVLSMCWCIPPRACSALRAPIRSRLSCVVRAGCPRIPMRHDWLCELHRRLQRPVPAQPVRVGQRRWYLLTDGRTGRLHSCCSRRSNNNHCKQLLSSSETSSASAARSDTVAAMRRPILLLQVSQPLLRSRWHPFPPPLLPLRRLAQPGRRRC
jgi:hypothetical protein